MISDEVGLICKFNFDGCVMPFVVWFYDNRWDPNDVMMRSSWLYVITYMYMFVHTCFYESQHGFSNLKSILMFVSFVANQSVCNLFAALSFANSHVAKSHDSEAAQIQITTHM